MDVSTSQEFINVYNKISKLESDITSVVKDFYLNLTKSYDEIDGTPENLSEFNNDLNFITKEEVEDKIDNIHTDDSNYLKKSGENKQECAVPTEFEELYTNTPDSKDSSDRVATTEFVHSLISDSGESVTRLIVGAVGKNYITSKSAQSLVEERIGEHKYGTVVNLVDKKIESAVSDINDSILNIKVPSKTSELSNDSGYITISDVPADAVTSVNGQTGNVQITIPQVPTNISSFNNDSGYITDAGVTSVNNRTGAVVVQENVQSNWSSTSGLSAILNKPHNVSAFTNDAGYLTENDVVTIHSSMPPVVPYGQVDDTSTSTAFTVTIPNITQLTDGVLCWVYNGVVDSAEGFTIDVNELGPKPVYQASNGVRSAVGFSIDSSMILTYNSTRVEGGCWDWQTGYINPNASNTSAYVLRSYYHHLTMADRTYRYRLLFMSTDGLKYVPANTSTSTTATSAKVVNQREIDPFGRIMYYANTVSVQVDKSPNAAYLRYQTNFTLGYSFNRTGAALTLTSNKPIYIKCAPQSNGSAIIDADVPYVLDLPTTEDGKIYIFLGVAYSATAVELLVNHPVYYYKDGAIRLWTGTENRIKQLEDKIDALYTHLGLNNT